MKGMFDDIDLSVYSRNAIIRLPHTLNTKDNRYKIPLSTEEVHKLDAKSIIELATERRLDFPYKELWADNELSEHIVTEVPNVRALQSVVEPRNIVTCVQDLYKAGPNSGNRNNVILRIASHYRRNGINSDACKAALLHWNQGQLEENVVLEKVEAVYNSGYQYGCNDPILASVCNPRCIYFKNKDYSVDVYSAQDLQNELEHRLTTDFSGRIIDLGQRFGLNNIDAVVYPGELMTIFGPTGANKTTLAQNLVYGYDHANDIIRKEWQIPTLYLSLELSGWYMQRRALQIISGKSKEYVNQHYYKLWEFHQDELAHVVVQTVSPTVKQIQEKVKEINPACVVVDYIDLIEPPRHMRGEYESVRYISHKLSSMAVNMDIIVLQISQISREYSRSQIIDLYAGKGSGAIENASRKVLGITGTANDPKKKIELLKNSDGDLFEYELEWTPSFRMRSKYYIDAPDTEYERRTKRAND
jgi:KaiC/GvpD/RAD55 family RecA-like ATPase